MTLTTVIEDTRYQHLAAAVDEHCPVLDLFRHPVPVDRTITAR